MSDESDKPREHFPREKGKHVIAACPHCRDEWSRDHKCKESEIKKPKEN